MNTKKYELNLLGETIDWASKYSPFQVYLPFYTEYQMKVSTHTPILSEDWGEHNLRHGPNSIRGTISELVTAVALVYEGYEIHQVTNKKEQKYGSDLKASKGALEYTISNKTTIPRKVDDDIELRLFRDYFEPAEWRVNFLSLVQPETKQIWLINYPLVGNMFCTKNDRGLYTPAFTTQSIPLKIKELTKVFPRGLQHITLQDNV